MSERWSRVVLAIFGIAALGVLVSHPWRQHELLYEGKSLEKWFEQLRTSDSGQAEMAISEIGPTAIPLLLKQVEIRELNATRHPRSAKLDSSCAGSEKVRLADRIISTVRLMGPAAIPPLLIALDDPDGRVRLLALRAIGALSPDADVIFPVLAKLLQDPDWQIQDTAVTLLGRMRHRRNLVVPVLLEALSTGLDRVGPDGRHDVRAHLVAELGRIGGDARRAVPELKALFNGTDRQLKREAAVALCRIDGDTNALAFLLAQLKDPQERSDCLPILLSIHKMGSAAKAAASPILAVVADSGAGEAGLDKELQDAARHVLRSIDPEAAVQTRGSR
jgi:HEAT repeat protein